jgi:hypothetical protein
MRWLLALGAYFLVVAAFASPCRAAASATLAVPAVPAPHPMPPDPALTDPAWPKGSLPVSGGFENLTTRSAARLGTHASILYDATNLYVAIQSDQAGVPIVASQTTNNVGFGLDDFVGVGIDTSGNGSEVYYFEATPRGVRYQQAIENSRYQPVWSAASSVTGNSWSVVLTIPLRVLRIHAGGAQTWRFNIIRNVASTAEHYSYGYDGVMTDGPIPNAWPNFFDVRFWPTLTGLSISNAGVGVRPRPRAEFYALGAAGLDRNQFSQANGTFAPQAERPIGLDASLPLTNTINFVTTIAPDFSNVEIDQQTIAPQEFRRALTEYRPFFSQGAAFVNPNPMQFFTVTSPGNLIFYSPDVGPFDRGAKVEGSYGLQSFGALTFRGFDVTTDETFDDLAFGYRHALPDRSFMYWTDGVLAHHSIAGNDETIEGGAAGRNLKSGLVYGVDDAIELGTYVPDPGIARSLNGFVDVHKPNYETFAGYADISPHYNPIDGFTVISDVHGPEGYLNILGSTPYVKNYAIFMGADRFLDRTGEVHEADTVGTLSLTLKNGFSLTNLGPQVGLLRGYDVTSGPSCTPVPGERTYFTGNPCYLGGRTDRFNFLGGGVGYRDGTPTPIDVAYNEGPFGTDYVHLFTTTTSRPLGTRYSLSLEYDGTYERDFTTGVLNSQWLRRVSIGASLGPDSNASISLRGINGTGGFALPGLNLAASYHVKLRSGNELYINWGTPAASATLDRLIVKYVLRIGGDAGT